MEVDMAKWVYDFEEGSEQLRNLLGGKGAGLAEMTRIGLLYHQVLQLQQMPAKIIKKKLYKRRNKGRND